MHLFSLLRHKQRATSQNVTLPYALPGLRPLPLSNPLPTHAPPTHKHKHVQPVCQVHVAAAPLLMPPTTPMTDKVKPHRVSVTYYCATLGGDAAMAARAFAAFCTSKLLLLPPLERMPPPPPEKEQGAQTLSGAMALAFVQMCLCECECVCT
jgi:hypothetical protein